MIVPWIDPIDFAYYIDRGGYDYAFLYSGLKTKYSGEFSFLGYDPMSSVKGDSFDCLERVISKCDANVGWFGYLSYELRHSIEDVEATQPSYISMPRLWFNNYKNVVIFDHKTHECRVYLSGSWPAATDIPKYNSKNIVKVKVINSNMTEGEYCQKVNYIINAIMEGDLYQANLTRKYYGNLEKGCDIFDIFANLCEISPSPYSALLKFGKYGVISSTPERFLKINETGFIESRPLKGTAPKFAEESRNLESIENLLRSQKDISENLMIVDLMRNDFSRNSDCVKVSELCKVESYPTIHHMYSTICGKMHCKTLDFVKGCFPPGSVTGAPKIKAMDLCARLEGLDRGVYSGAIGWFANDNTADLAVVIRTIIVEDDKFEFQVGGAIVADSNCYDELNETLIKAYGISKALNIDVSLLI